MQWKLMLLTVGSIPCHSLKGMESIRHLLNNIKILFTLMTARFRPGPAGLPVGSQQYWRPLGAQQGPTPHPQ